MIDPRIRGLHVALESRPFRRVDPEPGLARASVALILRPTPGDIEILLIERARVEGDPWSGHMALPGGRRESDEDELRTAIRETHEEVGIDLDRVGMLIGRLDDVHPSAGGPRIAVSPFVFVVTSDVTAVANPREVAGTVWIPLEHLSDPASAAEHLHLLPEGGALRFPALEYHDYVIWGLTHRMLIQFLGIVRSVSHGESSRG